MKVFIFVLFSTFSHLVFSPLQKLMKSPFAGLGLQNIVDPTYMHMQTLN